MGSIKIHVSAIRIARYFCTDIGIALATFESIVCRHRLTQGSSTGAILAFIGAIVTIVEIGGDFACEGAILELPTRNNIL